MKLVKKMSVVMAMAGIVVAFQSAPAFARQGDGQVDLTLDVATEAFGNTGAAVGFTVGGGYEIQDNLQLRLDLSYYGYSEDVAVPGWGTVSLDATRIPLDLGARYYFDLPPKGLRVFAQGAVEISFDSVDSEVVVPFVGAVKQTADDVNAGVTLGGGVDYSLSKEFSVGANMRGHIIDGSYVNFGFGGTYHF